MSEGNPFSITTPENISADELHSLFVPDVPGYRHIRDVGHAFLNGARGSGKSMIFRSVEPDCQTLLNDRALPDLPFFAVYVPIKETTLKQPSQVRFSDSHGERIFLEHQLALHCAQRFLWSIRERCGASVLENHSNYDASQLHSFFYGELLPAAFWEDEPRDLSDFSLKRVFQAIDLTLKNAEHIQNQYLLNIGLRGKLSNYEGPVFDYFGFLIPFVKKFIELDFMPHVPVYLLIDDADYLTEPLTRVLNDWLASRRTHEISLKVSTQMRYKTFLANNGMRVEAPHDFSEINISDVYTSDNVRGYRTRIYRIIERRIAKYRIQSTPSSLFPPDIKQEKEIERLADEIRDGWQREPRSARQRDDVYRYARPEFMKRMAGSRKQSSSYSYAGFDQLVHISSGVVRHFLDPAAEMFDLACARANSDSVSLIPPDIQDFVVRDIAKKMIFDSFEIIARDHSEGDVRVVQMKHLYNLIRSLGAFFLLVLKSDASERRVFSIALTDEPDKELMEILSLGVETGYLVRSTIGRKEGYGRTWLFVLTRRVAPAFNLDPNGFAAYKFVTNEFLWKAINDPKGFVAKLRQQRPRAVGDAELQRDLFQRRVGEDE